MEEILIIVLQGVFEIGLEILAYGGLDFFASFSYSRKEEKESEAGCGVVLIFLLLGLGLGWLANLIHPRNMLPDAWMRIANLIIGPPLAGGASWVLADWRRRRGAPLRPNLHFFLAFCFVLGYDFIRFVYGKH